MCCGWLLLLRALLLPPLPFCLLMLNFDYDSCYMVV